MRRVLGRVWRPGGRDALRDEQSGPVRSARFAAGDRGSTQGEPSDTELFGLLGLLGLLGCDTSNGSQTVTLRRKYGWLHL